jgi:hypothetical protein
MKRIRAFLTALTALVVANTPLAAQTGHEGHDHAPGEHPVAVTRNWAWPDSAVDNAKMANPYPRFLPASK